jgi:hypothetical protein
MWQDDLHYFANYIKRDGVSVQRYSKKYYPLYIDEVDYIMTPSSIYFRNLGIHDFDKKILDFFYFLDESKYEYLDNFNFENRINGVVLSGEIANGYDSRVEFNNLKSDKSFDDIIYRLEHPGYKNNSHMTELNYYKEISKYNKNVYVLPNAIDPTEKQYIPNPEKSERIRIAWIGGSSHLEDLKLLKDELLMKDIDPWDKIILIYLAYLGYINGQITFYSYKSIIKHDELTLAQQFYKDNSLWWIISIANTDKLNQSTLITPPGIQIRIPANYNAVISNFNLINS